ncbi:hypothetical protein DY000_02038973 [Brassica cretica]|uniref:Glutamine amidotransferase domain-containing protein n=2 Tax=Brassica TaxID=3705 RepID=A0ABQ7BLG8_BRACR|nr:hypothetical protein DY000_02038973 [Brassica cretica]
MERVMVDQLECWVWQAILKHIVPGHLEDSSIANKSLPRKDSMERLDFAVGRVPVKILMKYSPPFEIGQHLRSLLVGVVEWRMERVMVDQLECWVWQAISKHIAPEHLEDSSIANKSLPRKDSMERLDFLSWRSSCTVSKMSSLSLSLSVIFVNQPRQHSLTGTGLYLWRLCGACPGTSPWTVKAVCRVPVEILMKYSPPFEIGPHLRSILVGVVEWRMERVMVDQLECWVWQAILKHIVPGHLEDSSIANKSLPRKDSMERLDFVRTLLTDNYNSYTFNIYQALVLSMECLWWLFKPQSGRGKKVTPTYMKSLLLIIFLYRLDLIHICLSHFEHGSGSVGICLLLLLECRDIPILGVCLGHQALGYIYGDYVVHAPEPVHGRLSGIEHDGTYCFLVLHPGETLISRQVIYFTTHTN